MKSFKQHITEKRDIADINSSILRHQELALKASKRGDREAVAVHQAYIRKLRKDKADADKVKKEYVGPALTPANQIAKKHGGKVKSIMAKDEKGKKSKMFYVEEDELDEAFVIDKGAKVIMKLKNGKMLYGKVLKQQKVLGKAGVEVQWSDGTKGRFPTDKFSALSMDSKADYKIEEETESWLEDKWLGEEVISESPDASLKKKAEKTGIPFGILKQVFNRGKAAWRTGHRPGTTPDQWGHARVNSFATKSKGTWGGADKDLAAKVRGK